MSDLTILFDGWPFARKPNSPAAIHLLTLLAYLPEDVHALVALPAPSPFPLPARVTAHIEATIDTDLARFGWEQRTLSRLARKLGVDLVHSTSGNPALFGPSLTLLSPCGYQAASQYFAKPQAGNEELQTGNDELQFHGIGSGLGARLRDALGKGGRTRARGVLWPSDLPSPHTDTPVTRLPPVVHPAFREEPPRKGGNDNNGHTPIDATHPSLTEPDAAQSRVVTTPMPDLPETYILYHGPQTLLALHHLLEAWSWAAGAIGEYYPLLLPGLDDATQKRLAALVHQSGLNETVRGLPDLPIEALAVVYRRCSAVFHPAVVSPWGGSLRPAMAIGKPIVALETPLANALVGPAAYLAPEKEQGRALGAALITVIVEENVSALLTEAALQRADVWSGEDFRKQLAAAYQRWS